MCDLRTVDPADDDACSPPRCIAAGTRRCGSSRPPGTSTTASRRSCSRSPAPIPTASPRRRRAGSRSTSASRSHAARRDEVVGFVDVPGHVRFVKNMLAGVGAVDVAMLVVAANEGWMPQTEEHVRILELLGIEHGSSR